MQVTLDSGPRLTTSWTGADAPVIGERVSVSFAPLTRGETTRWIPVFGPAATVPDSSAAGSSA